MGNAGQLPHKWQEIELLERTWSVWALERHLFIHSWSHGQTDFMGLKSKKQRWCLMQFHKVEITCFFVHHWYMRVIWGKYSYRQAGMRLHKSSLKPSTDELNHKILNAWKGLLKYIYPRYITFGSMNQCGIYFSVQLRLTKRNGSSDTSPKRLCVVVFSDH